MIRRPPIATRTDTRFPYTTRFRALSAALGETCKGKFELTTPLYNIWAEYCRAAGDDPGSQKAMGGRLKRAGCQFKKSNGIRAYYGQIGRASCRERVCQYV